MIGVRERMKHNRKQLREELPRLRDQIVAQCNPERVVLFGSLSRNEENGLSDIDLMVIGESNTDFKSRQRRLRDGIDPSVPV